MLPVLTRISKMLLKLSLYAIITILLILSVSKLIVAMHARTRISSVNEVEHKPIAIVFGAGLWKDGSPTPVLRDRVKTAADLYFAGKVNKLLMSGDNRIADYNEPAAMRTHAQSLGDGDQDILL